MGRRHYPFHNHIFKKIKMKTKKAREVEKKGILKTNIWNSIHLGDMYKQEKCKVSVH